ncbi:NADPH-dependent FMN reductase [uncultured Actinomyces sp.]|uniref:NADPH-dependent FMN reductase n=1 Tax=uncultured Actinomyces sp. TaxID=249061 RepID=UPI0025CCCC4D|nr:NAD(P)H-dependent oxidoreductase [uncultured Actinomyces sp.]
MTSVAIVLGSVRPGRAGEQVVRWIEEQARQVDGVATVFFDLRDYNLPLFAEEMPPSMQAPELPEAVRLRTNIEAQDAVLFVTPEYNHSVSAVLKNAIDYLPPVTLKDKAVGLVGYSWYGAATPLEHLREIVSTFGADVRGRQVGINLGSDFQDGVFKPSDELNAQIRELLASLA